MELLYLGDDSGTAGMSKRPEESHSFSVYLEI